MPADQVPAYDSDIAHTAALLADRTRAVMLTLLLDGRPASAGELARSAGVTAQTASSHLARMLDSGLVTVVKQGRHRYYRLRGPEIAEVIEALSRISPPLQVRSLKQSRQAWALRDARTCYDHLAGRAGTAMLAALLDGGLLEPVPVGAGTGGAARARRPDSGTPGPREPVGQEPANHEPVGQEPVSQGPESYEVTSKGEERFGDLGIDVSELRGARRIFAASCLDWTERRPHLSGALGAALTARMIELGWFAHGPVRRALVLTDAGRRGLQDSFGCLPPA